MSLEEPNLLEYEAVWLGKWFPTFRKIVLPSFSGLISPKNGLLIVSGRLAFYAGYVLCWQSLLLLTVRSWLWSNQAPVRIMTEPATWRWRHNQLPNCQVCTECAEKRGIVVGLTERIWGLKMFIYREMMWAGKYVCVLPSVPRNGQFVVCCRTTRLSD